MTHANPPPHPPATLGNSITPQADVPPPPAARSGLVMIEQEGLFSSLPRHVTNRLSQPPAWWLDERARLAAKSELPA